MKQVDIFTDGACSGNPGPGGWGAILRWDGKERELSGGQALTTNNQMELTAAIRALEALKEKCAVNLYSDSSYVRDGIKTWIHNWKKNGWKTADKKPVKNADLWQALDAARCGTTSSFTGSKAMPAIRRTSAATSWRARRWRRSR